MKEDSRKVLADRLTQVGLSFMRVARRIQHDEIGQAYSVLWSEQLEIDKITFEVVKELGAIEERSR